MDYSTNIRWTDQYIFGIVSPIKDDAPATPAPPPWRRTGSSCRRRSPMTNFATTCPDEGHSHRPLLSALGAAAWRALLWPARVMAARRTLAQLASLSEYELRDIGL